MISSRVKSECLKYHRRTEINESCCINEGEYEVKKTFSPKFQENLFLVLNVDGRDGIRIHQANWMQQLHGCIAPVDWIINDKNKIFTGLNSAESLQELHKFIGGNEFTLTIIDNEQELVKQKLLIKNKNLVFLSKFGSFYIFLAFFLF